MLSLNEWNITRVCVASRTCTATVHGAKIIYEQPKEGRSQGVGGGRGRSHNPMSKPVPRVRIHDKTRQLRIGIIQDGCSAGFFGQAGP